MTCERAQEWFSDYVERGLDYRSMAAMTAHLDGCAACRGEVEVLRATWNALEAVPVVAPPPGLMAQTLSQIRQERAEAAYARQRPAPWLVWLQSLSPPRVALATSLATFVVVGALVWPHFSGVPLGWISGGSTPPKVTRAPVAPVDPLQRPTLSLGYGERNGNMQQVRFVVRSPQQVPDAQFSLDRYSAEFRPAWSGTMLANKEYLVDAWLPVSPSPELVTVRIASEQGGVAWSYYCAVPFARRDPGDSVSVTFVDTALPHVMREMAAKTGRSVVADASDAVGLVTAAVSERPAGEAWQAILGPLNLRLTMEGGTYVIQRAP